MAWWQNWTKPLQLVTHKVRQYKYINTKEIQLVPWNPSNTYIEKCSWKSIIRCFVCFIWDERNANQKCAGVFLWVFKDTDPKVKRSVLKYLGHLFHCSVILVIKFIHKTAKITLFFFKLKAYWEVWLSCFLSNHLLFLLRKHLQWV